MLKHTKFNEMTLKELKSIVLASEQAVESDCFGVSDLLNSAQAQEELNKRGYELIENKRFTIRKRDIFASVR